MTRHRWQLRQEIRANVGNMVDTPAETWFTLPVTETTTTDQEVATMLNMSNATTLAEACRQAEQLGRSLPGCTGGTFKVLNRCPMGSVLGSREVEVSLDADGRAFVR